jgi:DNA ligase (NAD+)
LFLENSFGQAAIFTITMSKERTRAMQQRTEQLLKQVKEGTMSNKNIEDLRDVLRFHEHRYYIENDPLVSDFEYDSLFKQLEALEK